MRRHNLHTPSVRKWLTLFVFHAADSVAGNGCEPREEPHTPLTAKVGCLERCVLTPHGRNAQINAHKSIFWPGSSSKFTRADNSGSGEGTGKRPPTSRYTRHTAPVIGKHFQLTPCMKGAGEVKFIGSQCTQVIICLAQRREKPKEKQHRLDGARQKL